MIKHTTLSLLMLGLLFSCSTKEAKEETSKDTFTQIETSKVVDVKVKVAQLVKLHLKVYR